MALINITSSKKMYTRVQDEQIIALKNEGKTVEEISAAVGHSPASVNYRISRVLAKHDKFDTIKYKGAAAAAAKVAVPASKKV